MSSSGILKFVGGMVIAIILLYSFFPGEKLTYDQTIEQHRAEINDFMKDHQDSPLPDSLKASFAGLNYFTPNPDFKVNASLEIIPGNPVLTIATSDGETMEYRRYAYAYFALQGQENRVTLLQPEGEDQENLFLPFGDLSNGTDTYGGGRYLDLETTGKRNIEIDFNLAYNPYCVYSTDYSCPLPPVENQLSVAIRAGEKNFALPN